MGTGELSGKPDKCLGVTCDGLAFHPGVVAILLVASCYRNQDKLRQLSVKRLVRLNLTCSIFYKNVDRLGVARKLKSGCR